MISRLKIGVSLSGFDLQGNLSRLLMQSGYEIVKPEKPLRDAVDIRNFFDSCEVIIAGSEPLDLLVSSSKKLKLILRAGVGINNISPAVCEAKGITWIIAESQVAESVSNFVLGHVLNISSGTYQNRIFDPLTWRTKIPKGISNSTIGIIGFGRIGTSLLTKLLHFPFAQFKIHDISSITFDKHLTSEQRKKIEQVDLDSCLSQSDIVSVHVPLNKSTKNLLNHSNLALMSQDSWLINTSRGEILDEISLYNLLEQQRLGGAILDVFREEPYTGPLINLKNAILTPHIGTYNIDTRVKVETFLVTKALDFISSSNNSGKVEKL